MISQKEIRRLFSYNKCTGILRWKQSVSKRIRPGDIAGTIDHQGYVRVTIKSKMYKVHRLIWCGVYGYWPKKDIDHKDRIRHHNWLDNLRESTRQGNCRNIGNPKNNTSGVKGVYFNKSHNKWQASIAVNKQLKHIGYFNDFNEAVCHRLAAEQCIGWLGSYSNSPAYEYVKDNILC